MANAKENIGNINSGTRSKSLNTASSNSLKSSTNKTNSLKSPTSKTDSVVFKKSNRPGMVVKNPPKLIGSALYETKKKARKLKKRVLFFISLGLIVLFFTFGLLSKSLFGDDSWITQVATENIVDVINIVRFFDNSLPAIFRSISCIMMVLIIVWILKSFVNLLAKGGNRRKTILNLIGSFVRYIGAIVMIMLLLSVWGVDTTTLLASLGILGLIIGLGAQTLISDILSGLFIIFENSFQVGDIVTIDGSRGEVTDIGIRTTKLKTAVGDVKIINNSEIKTLLNMSMHRSVAICDVTISYGENIAKVEKIIKDNLESIALKFPSITDGPKYLGPAEFSDRGVVLKIIAKCDEKERFQLNRDLNREMKLLFDKYKIKIAVPQVQIQNNK